MIIVVELLLILIALICFACALFCARETIQTQSSKVQDLATGFAFATGLTIIALLIVLAVQNSS